MDAHELRRLEKLERMALSHVTVAEGFLADATDLASGRARSALDIAQAKLDDVRKELQAARALQAESKASRRLTVTAATIPSGVDKNNNTWVTHNERPLTCVGHNAPPPQELQGTSRCFCQDEATCATTGKTVREVADDTTLVCQTGAAGTGFGCAPLAAGGLTGPGHAQEDCALWSAEADNLPAGATALRMPRFWNASGDKPEETVAFIDPASAESGGCTNNCAEATGLSNCLADACEPSSDENAFYRVPGFANQALAAHNCTSSLSLSNNYS